MKQDAATPVVSQASRLRSAVRALVRRFSIAERADVGCCGVTVAQAATLEALAATPRMRLGALGRRLGVAPSTLTRNLARLLEEGLVARVDDPGDGRASRVALTAAGERAAQGVRRQEEAFAAAVLGRLPPGRRTQVVEALQELLVAIGAATESCCPGAFDHLMQEGTRQKPHERRSREREECCRRS